MRLICYLLGHNLFKPTNLWNEITEVFSQISVCQRCGKIQKRKQIKIWGKWK